ncbi:DNA-3-methyladenine glycosylase II [Virgibacillus subterraneus]|uniref:DNA-3-methyladenine glycosylase II n=1 Tax=Virgibacillus subterraneus TaxID=621109 RepID=A0A1H9HRE1_9BACI|nr:DNA-3-methyladenine glycosylase [Virgibacillus subterraneus]SEQ64914.1 DNA-3-methyladenine glycosylase II [Virgibacillus subterraneus]
MEKIKIYQDDKSVEELCNADSQMKKLIQIIGDIEVVMRLDFFTSLVRSMIGQQISVQAANAIYTRLESLMENNITATSILKASEQRLRSIGLSARKVIYLRDLAEKVYHNEVDLQKLHKLDNQTVIKQLTSIKGIGKWTAEMFLIFSLGRMNVLALDDIGIQRGAKWLYEVEKSERRKILAEKQPVWSPHLTIASFYLWETVHLDLVKKYNSIEDIGGE